MKVYSLLGGSGNNYEGESLLGVFGSKAELLKFVEQEKSGRVYRPETLGYDDLGCVESELGQPIDYHAQVEYL